MLNPGATTRGLHRKSLVTYGGNKAPEVITCCHERSPSSWPGLLSGYGTPQVTLVHNIVGLQHSKAIYGAWFE